MLAKPTQQVAHGGGLRFEKDSAYYKTIYDWIAQGVPFGDPAKDTVAALESSRRKSSMTKPGETAPVKVVARFEDGQTRDVTQRSDGRDRTCPMWPRSTLPSNVIRASASAKPRCWCAIRASSATVPVTVLNPKPGFAWKPLPQHNYIDQQIDAKLQKLKIQPSPATDDATFLRRVSLDLTGQLAYAGRGPRLPRRCHAVAAEARRR